MRFTVVSLPAADEQLAEIWTSAPDPQAIAAASDRIDKLLANDPLKKVRPLDNYFCLAVEPLVVLCEINEDDRIVCIIEIHRNA